MCLSNFNTILFILVCNILHAQMLSPQTIGSTGRSTSVAGVILEDHIGSTWTQTIHTPAFIYTQGFLQPDAGTTQVVPYINLIGGYHTLDAQGSTIVNIPGNIMLEYTIGEVVSITLDTPQNMLTQGILQPMGKHWTGVVNTSWMVTGNWSPPFIPTDRDDVIIPPDCPNYPIITNGVHANCKNLLLMNGSSVDVKIGGSLTAAY